MKLTRFVLLLGLAVGAVAAHAQTARPATAVAQVVYGYVVGVTLTDGGAGYGVPPTVSFTGGGGTGAIAETRVGSGVVDQIVLINAGSGYASQITVSVAAPKMPMIESVRLRSELRIQGRLGATHQILATDALVPPVWRVMTNLEVTSSPYLWMDPEAPLKQRYYQVAGETEAPALGPLRLSGNVLAIRGTVGTTNWILGRDLAVPHVWRVLTNVVVSSSPYVWVDEAASTLGRQYQVSTKPEVPVEKVDPRQWAWIPPGMFRMGSPATERGRFDTEGPQTRVILTQGFWMGRYEVRQEEYLAVMKSNPSSYKGDSRRPVEQVSWNDATNYCGKLTALERAAGRLPAGYEYRLPTEAQWEYACRAGTTTRYSFGDALGCGDGCDYCGLLGQYMWWCGNNSPLGPKRVGGKLPNPWGLYDMHGNVWEWCADWYYRSYPGGNMTDPKGPNSGSYRVIRGGSWYIYADYCRSAYRSYNNPTSRYYVLLRQACGARKIVGAGAAGAGFGRIRPGRRRPNCEPAAWPGTTSALGREPRRGRWARINWCRGWRLTSGNSRAARPWGSASPPRRGWRWPAGSRRD